MKNNKSIRAGFKPGSSKNPLPYVRYSNVSISDVSNEKFPEMVQITAGPSKFEGLIGKRYVNLKFGMLAVDEAQAESIIGNGLAKVADELAEAGLLIPAIEIVR